MERDQTQDSADRRGCTARSRTSACLDERGAVANQMRLSLRDSPAADVSIGFSPIVAIISAIYRGLTLLESNERLARHLQGSLVNGLSLVEYP